ncbi:MAG: restriction endonuclease subunit S [Oscillospiraceae bacterium]|nr:restriction endonuclease subunit S [Oscillospiraceae bacterium]
MMATIKSVSNFVGDGNWIESKDQSTSGIRLIQTGNIGVGTYLDKVNRAKYISEQTFSQLNCTEVLPGDILISRLPDPVGRACVVPDRMGKAITAVDCTIIRLNPEVIDSQFFINFTQSSKYFEQLQQFLTGTTRTRISRKNLEKIEIPIPSLNKQRETARVLDQVTTLLHLRKQQLAKLDELVKARFVEMFSACTPKDKLGNMVSVSRGASPRPISAYVTEDIDGVNWIKIGDVPENSLYIEHTKEKITLEGAKKSRYVYKGDFILSNSMSFGRPYILNIDGCVHDGWLIISDYLATFHPLYLYYAIRDFEVQSQFSEKVNGATVKNLNSDLVKSTLIKVPPMELQQQFSESVLKMEQTKLTIQQSLDKLELLKKSLMQEYFE